jgi:hypothetical protein
MLNILLHQIKTNNRLLNSIKQPIKKCTILKDKLVNILKIKIKVVTKIMMINLVAVYLIILKLKIIFKQI